jgi:hypothetical protein
MRNVSAAIIAVLASALVSGAGCGDDSGAKKPDETPPLTPEEPAAPPLPPLGVAALKDLNYLYGPGAKPYEKVTAALKKKERDWAAVQAAAEETLAKDPGHLDARWHLGVALAQLGDHAGAAEHLQAALLGDFLRWGPRFAEDKALAEHFASAEGKALLERHLEIKAAVEKQVAGGAWLLGRRSPFKWPAKSGTATTRGELYAWDEETRRFVRITQTGHQLAAWLPSPTGDRIALVGYDRADLPAKSKEKTAAPTIRAWVEAIDARTFERVVQRATFKGARAVEVAWGSGGQLLVTTPKASGRWATTPGPTFAIDATTGKAVKSAAAADPTAGRAVVSLDEAVVWGPSKGLGLTPSPLDPALIVEVTLAAGGAPIAVPESGVGDGAVPRVSPSGQRVALATWVDPCGAADAAKPSLYVADASGKTTHLLTADSRFQVRWLSDDRLIYEDGTGSLRIWDATTGREVTKIADKGLALDGLSASPRAICRQEPLADVPTEAPGEEEMPVEEPASRP